MASEQQLREQLATCTRIFAMQGLIGLFGHVSVFQPETKTIFVTPGSGSDKANFTASDMIPIDLSGKPTTGTIPRHGVAAFIRHSMGRARCARRRSSHTPRTRRCSPSPARVHPVTLQGNGLRRRLSALQRSHLVHTPHRAGDAMLKTIGNHRALLMRGHGIVVAGKSWRKSCLRH